MITRHLSRLIIGITALALTTSLLFSSTIRSAAAGKGDRSAPTTPTNLVATAITETTVSLRWNASTDNSGKLSYQVRITNLKNSAYNSIATVSQTLTTYTAKYLATNSAYTFSVYAVDGNGNRSADSNVINVSTLADTTPPSVPVLQATVVAPSRVQLTWTESTDNVPNNCCSYSINVNGSPFTQTINWAVAPMGKLSAIVRHLTPGTAYSFSVNVSDWSGGNAATSNTVYAVTESSSDVTPPTAPTNLHPVQNDGCAELWIGWTEAIDNVDPQEEIEYEIYVNGVLSPLPVSSGVDFDFVYGTAFGDNIFTVKAVDRSGNSSPASRPLKLFLSLC